MLMRIICRFTDKSKKQSKKSKDKRKKNSDDEALEESDSFDEGQEVDYITGSERLIMLFSIHYGMCKMWFIDTVKQWCG